MKKDFKIGMLVGLAIIIVAAVWLSVQPAISVSSRLRRLQNQQRQSQSEGPQIFGPNQPEEYRPFTDEEIQQENETIEDKQPEQSLNKKQTNQLPPVKVNETRYHTVRSGQTLSDIAVEYYGSANQWTKIRDANPGIDPYKLKPGTTLIIPP